MQKIKHLLLTLLMSLFFSLILSSKAYSAIVTIDENLIDNIYRQSVFGASAIDIRFNATLTIPYSPFLTVNSNTDINNLYNFAQSVNGTNFLGISLFFVDAINFCGNTANNIVGCSATTQNNDGTLNGLGSISMVDADFVATSLGGIVIAHELGHNLGLTHIIGTNTNLMNEVTYSSSVIPPLTAEQVNTIILSKLIQTDSSGQKFLEVTPFAVIASVPEPSTWLMLLIGLVLIALSKRKDQSKSFKFNSINLKIFLIKSFSLSKATQRQ